MSFKVGDRAVYPGHGPGQITAIETKNIMGGQERFYSILLSRSDMKIMIPERRMKNLGLRSIMTNKTAKDVLQIITNKPQKPLIPSPGKNWSKRYNEYMKLIKTGDIIKTAQVFRELLDINTKKGLSFYEKQLMITVCHMLFDELSIIMPSSQLKKAFDFKDMLASLKQQ